MFPFAEVMEYLRSDKRRWFHSTLPWPTSARCFFYVVTRFREKDAHAVDEKLITKVNWWKGEGQARLLGSQTSIPPLRAQVVLLATRGRHLALNRAPIHPGRAGGADQVRRYSIGYRSGHPHVRFEQWAILSQLTSLEPRCSSRERRSGDGFSAATIPSPTPRCDPSSPLRLAGK